MYWQRRSNNRVYIYGWSNGRQHALPRDASRHLDALSDEEVDAYVRTHWPTPPRQRTVRRTSHPTLDRYVEGFLAHAADKGLNPATVSMKRLALVDHVLPYFLGHEPPFVDPNDWPQRSAKLLEHLKAKGVSAHEILRCNTSLSGLWGWLQDEGIVPAWTTVRLRRPRMVAAPTPLKYTLRPETVVEFAAKAEPEIAFMALAGFFFSLRTQELFGLTRADFRGGSHVEVLECAKVMRKAGLYDRLVVHITKQYAKSTGDRAAPPKNHSKGWVACFNEAAARQLVALVAQLAETRGSGTLVRFTPDYNLARWGRSGIRGVTLKDLRRASIYWLGHHTSMDLIELRSHARHRKVETTALYLRRPEEFLDELDALDLDL